MSESQDEAFVVDLTKRTIYTAVESAAAAGVVLWGGSGLNISSFTNIAGIEKAWGIVGIGVLAAFVASIRTTVAQFWSTKSDRAQLEAVGHDYLDEAEAKVKALGGKHAAASKPASAGADRPVSQVTGKPLPPLVTGSSPTAQAIQAVPTTPPQLVDDSSPEASEPIGGPASTAAAPEAETVVFPAFPAAPARVTVYNADGNALGYVTADAIWNGQSA